VQFVADGAQRVTQLAPDRHAIEQPEGVSRQSISHEAPVAQLSEHIVLPPQSRPQLLFCKHDCEQRPVCMQSTTHATPAPQLLSQLEESRHSITHALEQERLQAAPGAQMVVVGSPASRPASRPESVPESTPLSALVASRLASSTRASARASSVAPSPGPASASSGSEPSGNDPSGSEASEDEPSRSEPSKPAPGPGSYPSKKQPGSMVPKTSRHARRHEAT
jgi:hypothetical protein